MSPTKHTHDTSVDHVVMAHVDHYLVKGKMPETDVVMEMRHIYLILSERHSLSRGQVITAFNGQPRNALIVDEKSYQYFNTIRAYFGQVIFSALCARRQRIAPGHPPTKHGVLEIAKGLWDWCSDEVKATFNYEFRAERRAYTQRAHGAGSETSGQQIRPRDLQTAPRDTLDTFDLPDGWEPQAFRGKLEEFWKWYHCARPGEHPPWDCFSDLDPEDMTSGEDDKYNI